MRNRPVWFLGAHASCVLFSASCRRVFVHAKMPNTACWKRAVPFVLLVFAPILCFGQEPAAAVSPGEVEAEQVVVSATRFDIPLDQSPSSVSVISSEDIEQKQIERASDALREVPGLSVVQTGTAGQLTSVFMRGLPSEDMQVLLDGIPINQGLSGAMNFADITTDDIERIEVVRGPQSALYGP